MVVFSAETVSGQFDKVNVPHVGRAMHMLRYALKHPLVYHIGTDSGGRGTGLAGAAAAETVAFKVCRPYVQRDDRS